MLTFSIPHICELAFWFACFQSRGRLSPKYISRADYRNSQFSNSRIAFYSNTTIIHFVNSPFVTHSRQRYAISKFCWGRGRHCMELKIFTPNHNVRFKLLLPLRLSLCDTFLTLHDFTQNLDFQTRKLGSTLKSPK